MPRQNFISDFIINYLRKYYSVKEQSTYSLGSPKNILIIRQHNQFGDMLATVPLFRAIKESYPTSIITLIASPENYFAVSKNNFIDELFVFDKRKLLNPFYVIRFLKVLKREYDIAIVPATVSISNTSCILAALSNSKIKIGPKSLNGTENKIAFLFHHRINLNWRKNPDAYVSDFILDIVRPFRIKTQNFKSHINFEKEDEIIAEKFISTLNLRSDEYLIGFHVGAGKPQNRWPLEKYLNLIKLLGEKYKIKIYFTGSSSDKNEINFMKKNFQKRAGYFINKTIPQLAALISKSDLFITNDTGVMHVAGTTSTPQISIFGPTNPFNWAPIGSEKYFIRKSDLIADVIEEDVLHLCELIFNNHKKK